MVYAQVSPIARCTCATCSDACAAASFSAALAGTLKRMAQELRGAGPAQLRIAYPEPQEDFAPFAIPSSDAPRVSIVMPVYNKIAYTSACLRSIAAHAGAIPFEVIVVDDASSDATPQRLADVTGVRSVRNADNLGFIGSCKRRRRDRTRRLRAVPQQRHRRHGRLARSARRLHRTGAARRPRRRQAGVSGWAPAGSRRHRVRRRVGLELRPFRRPGRSALRVPARGGLLLRRGDPASTRPVRAARRVRHALQRRPTTRTPILRSPCVPPASRRTTSPRRPSFTSKASRRVRMSAAASSATKSSIARNSSTSGKMRSLFSPRPARRSHAQRRIAPPSAY